MSKNHNEVKIYMQVQNYDVKVFIEFARDVDLQFRKLCLLTCLQQKKILKILKGREKITEDPEGGEGGGV